MLTFGVLLIGLGCAYGLLFILDALMRAFDFLPYTVAVSNAGIDVRLFQIRWYTKSFNRLFVKIGRFKPNLLRLWFLIGAWVSALLLIPAMVLLVQTLVNNLVQVFGSESAMEQQGSVFVLQPVLPGVNMPLGELGYYFVTLLICSIIHEAGHAVAAVEADVRVLGFGVMVLFALPAAHVDLPTDQLLALRKSRQLRVFAAGVWHNIVLAALAYLALFSAPGIFAPFFLHGEGIAVASIAHGSAVRGPKGLKVGDAIVAVNDCPVKNVFDWRNCLARSIMQPTTSVCMKRELVARLNESAIGLKQAVASPSEVVDCCDSSKASSNLCFVGESFKAGDWKGHACLPVRNVLEQSRSRCNATALCGEDSFCMRPSLGNSSRLLQMQRSNGAKLDFLFVGSPAEVYQGVDVTDYVPRSPSAPVRLPSMMELLAHYVASFSGALAVLNVVPCFMLDGQHMARVLVDICCSCYDDNTRSVVSLTFTIVGTVLLILNILVGLWRML